LAKALNYKFFNGTQVRFFEISRQFPPLIYLQMACEGKQKQLVLANAGESFPDNLRNWK